MDMMNTKIVNHGGLGDSPIIVGRNDLFNLWAGYESF